MEILFPTRLQITVTKGQCFYVIILHSFIKFLHKLIIDL